MFSSRLTISTLCEYTSAFFLGDINTFLLKNMNTLMIYDWSFRMRDGVVITRLTVVMCFFPVLAATCLLMTEGKYQYYNDDTYIFLSTHALNILKLKLVCLFFFFLDVSTKSVISCDNGFSVQHLSCGTTQCSSFLTTTNSRFGWLMDDLNRSINPCWGMQRLSTGTWLNISLWLTFFLIICRIRSLWVGWRKFRQRAKNVLLIFVFYDKN